MYGIIKQKAVFAALKPSKSKIVCKYIKEAGVSNLYVLLQ